MNRLNPKIIANKLMDGRDKGLQYVSVEEISSWGMYRQVKMEQIVDSLLQKIEKPKGIQLEKIIEEWCKVKKIGNQTNLDQWKLDNGLNEDQWKNYVTRKWRWTKWCLKEYKEQLPNYYLERKAMLDKVKYGLIRVKGKDLVNELYIRIKEGEASFEEIAKVYSEGPERETYGNIGPIALGQANPDLAKLLAVSNQGQLWPPKRLDSWWIIVKFISLYSIPLDEKLSIDLSLELGLKHLQQTVNSNINSLQYSNKI